MLYISAGEGRPDEIHAGKVDMVKKTQKDNTAVKIRENTKAEGLVPVEEREDDKRRERLIANMYSLLLTARKKMRDYEILNNELKDR